MSKWLAGTIWADVTQRPHGDEVEWNDPTNDPGTLIDSIQGEITVLQDSGSGALKLSHCQHLALFRLAVYDNRPC